MLDYCLHSYSTLLHKSPSNLGKWAVNYKCPTFFFFFVFSLYSIVISVPDPSSFQMPQVNGTSWLRKTNHLGDFSWECSRHLNKFDRSFFNELGSFYWSSSISFEKDLFIHISKLIFVEECWINWFINRIKDLISGHVKAKPPVRHI